ncbi:MAG: hypothetical protein K2W96_00695, partial [Gemmataceae bacterium]|nr:hypothetical protein [Gemmataceae bacterium]
VKCPECEKILNVPDAEEERPAERQRSGKPAPSRRDEDEDDRPKRKARGDDEEDDRPRRKGRDDEDDDDRASRRKKGKKAKKGGSSMTLMLGIGGGVLGLGLVGFLLWWFLGGSGGGAAAAWIPGDGEGFLSVKLSAVWKNEATQKLLTAMRAQGRGGRDPADEMRDWLGLGPEEVDRLTFVVKQGRGQLIWVVVETLAAYDEAKVKSKIRNGQESTHEGKKLFAATGRFGADAVHFVNSRVFVHGPVEGVKAALAMSAKGRPKGALDDGISLMGNHLSAAFTMTPDTKQNLDMMLSMGPMFRDYAPLAKYSSGTVKGNLGKTLDLEASIKYADDGSAQAAKSAGDKGIKTLTGLLIAAKIVQPAQAKGIEAAEKMLDELKLSQSGARLVARISTDASSFDPSALQGLDDGPPKDRFPPKDKDRFPPKDKDRFPPKADRFPPKDGFPIKEKR